MANLRPTTNLVVPPHLSLPKKALKEKFLYVYTGAYTGTPTSFMTKLWASVLFPSLANDPKFGRIKPRNAADALAKAVPAGYLRVKKVMDPKNPHFIVNVPLMSFMRHGGHGAIQFLRNFMLGEAYTKKVTDPSAATIQELRDLMDKMADQPRDQVIDQKIPTQKVVEAMKLDALGAAALKQSLLGVRIQTKGGLSVVFADFVITKEEAQQLTTTEWIELRDIDLYPLLLHWVFVGFGARGLAPVAAFPISKIAFSLPPSHSESARVNEYSLSIGPNGRAYYLPRSVDKQQTIAYEDKYTQSGAREDGSFCMYDINEGASMMESGSEPRVKLPVNMVICVDWLNNKYSYTDTSGFLHVEDLTRFQVANDSHIRTLLDERAITDKEVAWFVNMGIAAGVQPSEFTVTEKDLPEGEEHIYNRAALIARDKDPKAYFDQAVRDYFQHVDKDRVPFSAVSIHGYPPLVPLARYFKKIEAAVKDNIEAVYLKYSVSTVMQLFPWLVMLSHYADDMEGLRAKDQAIRQAALEQKVDPSWKMPSVPLVKKDMGLLPHQVKVQNLMKDDPDLALMPIQTGGGKCLAGDTFVTTQNGISTIEDVFYEYKDVEATVHGPGYWRLNKPLSLISKKGQLEEVKYLYRSSGSLTKVELADGTVIEGLEGHRLFTQNGWKFLHALDETDYVLNQPPASFNEVPFKFEHPVDYVEEARTIYSRIGNKQCAGRVSSLDNTTIPVRMTKALAFILGALVAEGNEFKFHNSDRSFVSQYIKAFLKVFGTTPRVKVSRGVYSVGSVNHAIRTFLQDTIGNLTSSEHSVPDCVKFSTKEHQKYFLRALIEGDGEVTGIEGGQRKGYVKYYTISKKLHTEVFQMLKNFGFHPHKGSEQRKRKTWVTGNGHKGKITKHTCYSIGLPLKENALFEEEIGFSSVRKQAFLRSQVKRNRVAPNGQNSNDTNQGWHNKVPSKDEVQEFIFELEECLDPQDFDLPGGRSEHPVLFKQCCRRSVTGRFNSYYCVGEGETRYNLNMFFKVIEDERIQKAIQESESLQDKLKRIKWLASKTWAKVVKVTPNVRNDYVYDFVLPKTRAYVANGYMSHNTPMLLVDLLLRFKENKSEPYLVICPNHLVPNYVTEAVYFTDGKLNVIAITNVAIRQNGWKRLQAIVEAAPRNTVVVVAMDTLRFRPRAVSYGTTPTTVFPVIDFLRQFKFGYVAIDEAHRIKGKTARNKAVMALISDIPKKRLASGTFVHDSPSDLAMTIAALDPTVFGTREEFNDTYGEVVRGGRVIKWKEGAQVKIMQKIKTRCVVAGAMRKEWAAFLPKKVEWVGGVDLTDAQQAVYEDILNETIEQIEQDAKTNKELQKFLRGKAKAESPTSEDDEEESDEEKEEGERAIDEDEGEDLASMLNPYLARLEQFLVAPGADILGKRILKGEDLLSPKVAMVYNRIRLHIFGGEIRDPRSGQQVPYGPFPGKVIIFVNQIAAADEIFNRAPADLKKLGLLYKADQKVEILSQLEKNPNKKWVVGVVTSMEEGLNLQFGSRIIRVSSPWNPGNLEQSNARIERPEFKKQETRNQIFFDSIVANKTYDITKQARLIAKVIAAAKFENTDNPDYETIPDMPIVPMNLDTIRVLNTWHGTGPDNPGLIEYNRALAKYQQVRNDDYLAYKEAYIAKHGSGPVMAPLEAAPTPPDAKLLLRTPYVPGLGLYNQNELGLVRIDEYLNIVSTNEDEDEGGEDEGEDSDENGNGTGGMSEAEQRAASLIGQLVHTEFGEGYIKKVSAAPGAKFMSIELLNGYRVRIRRPQVFLITRTMTSNKDIRNQILKSIGKMPIATAPDVPADSWKQSRRAQQLQQEHQQKQEQKEQKVRQEKQQKDLSIELTLFVANGFLGLDYLVDEHNPTAMKVLQAHGFRTIAPYYYSKVANYKALNNQMKLWKNSGLMADPVVVKQGVFEAFQEMYNLLKSGQIKNHKETYRVANQQKVVNFYRLEHKPSNRNDLFKPYPIIQDGQAYIALPTGQAGTRMAMKYKRPSFRWIESDPTLSFFGTIPQIAKTIKSLTDAGVSIANIEELRKEFAKVKVMKVRDPNEDGVPT